ncbi:type II toxin-antitoxin system PemK/MazF family toxin [Bosea sp. LjRoot237]|uniref:type II toxin-antitoxin system PemK/MazF family toxin n=1 Tax=Bosea sp. LjRoot237 TaxID=3342292 RepID=UPI003ECD588E
MIVAAAGDYGEPCPAVIIQTDAIPAAHASVVVCQMTSTLVDASDLRVTIEPSADNGLRERSQVMIDKPVTLMRSRISSSIGRLSVSEMAPVTAGLAFVIGVAD